MGIPQIPGKVSDAATPVIHAQQSVLTLSARTRPLPVRPLERQAERNLSCMNGIRIVPVIRSAEEFGRIDSQTHVSLQQKVGDGDREPFHVLFVGFCDRPALHRRDNYIT